MTGGSFPAEMWRLFMEPALDNVEPAAFPEPKVWPTWKPFTRGEYALEYDPTPAAHRDRRHGVLDVEAASAACVGPLTHRRARPADDRRRSRPHRRERAAPAGGARRRSRGAGTRPARAGDGAGRPSSVSELGDGRLRSPRVRDARRASDRLPRRCGSAAAGPAPGWVRPPGSRRAARCRPRPMRWFRSSSSRTAGATS